MSNRLTFSLASLILIMALGLVFAPVSVMAHAPLSDGTTGDNNKLIDIRNHPNGMTQGTHTHPSIVVTIGDGKDANPNTADFDVVDADDDAEGAAGLTPTITFDVTLTLPVGAEAKSNAVTPVTFATDENRTIGVTGNAYYSDFLKVGDVSFTDGGDTWTKGMGADANKWTGSLTLTLPNVTAGIDDTATTAARNKAKADAMKKGITVDVIVHANMIQTTGLVGGPMKDQPNLESTTMVTVIPKAVAAVVADPDPVMFAVSGTPSLTVPFTATFTSTSKGTDGKAMGATILDKDITVTGGYHVKQSRNSNSSPADAPMTVWTVIVQPYPATEMVSVTIADDATTAAAADTVMGTLMLSAPEATLNTIAPATGADDTKAFLVTLTFAAALPTGIVVNASDLTVTNGTAGTPSIDAADAKMWHVLISPTMGKDTKIELSKTGKVKFAYSGSAVTVMKKAAAVVIGDITASYDATDMETSLSGTIGANGFVVIGAAALPDLEEFFDVGGTIGLHDADAADGNDKNSREVVISEILWGLDFGAMVIADQKQWQFIELYNTTGAAIPLDGWTLKFTEGRPVPKSDVDQVSNRAGAGWVVDIGQSGRVTGTRATDATTTITPINIVSMYRNINYAKVEKVKADGSADPNRAEQLKGIPGGNGKGSWKASQRRDPGTTDPGAARWIYSTRARKHYSTTKILTASPVARSPFIINEVGNGVGDTNDWVELRNVTTSEASLKNYHLSYVSGHNSDTSLVNFHDKDIKVPGGGVILLVNTNPQNTGIAAGRNAAVVEADQVFTGVTSRYYVNSNLKLPDNGKFNLILRNAHDKLKASSHFMDVIGGVVVVDDTKGTSLWPLVATGAPHGDVVEANGRDLKSGYVYIRKNAGGGTGEHHLGRVGYTGVGYDRTAAKSDANGGTPGYDNGALKDKIAGLTEGSVTISEIMVDTGEARQSLAQWVELHNSSMTQAVNLNGWKLHIENAASENGDLETNTFSAILTLGDIKIAPNQTVLIASTSGRVSDPDHFPSTRVINLWTTKAYRDALEMVRRTDPVLSTTGFNITLADKDNKPVDSAGNLDGNRRTRDEIAWMLPMSEDDGRRSSLLRVYQEGVAITGTMKEAWVSADATNLAFAISQTFYGDSDDFGTPGFKAGGPLPVSLSKFRPERLDNGSIRIVWVTESELNNAGFNILRSDARDGEFKQINTKLIAGQGTTSERTTYTHVDTSAKPNVVYYYQIQDVSLDGKVQTLRLSRLKGHVSPAGKITTTWGDIKALQ